MLSRLITTLSMLAKDPAMPKALLQLSTLYLPHEAAAIGVAVVEAWPQVLRPDSDAALLHRMWHSSRPDCRLRQLLDSEYDAARLTLERPANVFTLGT